MKRTDIRLTADVRSGRDEGRDVPREEGPFVIGVLGDFRGRSSGSPRPIHERRFLDIDRDNFDEVLSRLDVRWEGTLSGVPGSREARSRAELVFRSMDDFTPDGIVQQAVPLRLLLETGKALEDPARFDAVAEEIGRWADLPAAEPTSAGESPAAPPPPSDVDPADLLDAILDREGASARMRSADPWKRDFHKFLQDAVRPHLVTIDTRLQADLAAAVDRALSEQVRRVMHDPEFRRLEAVWQGLRVLVSRTETGPDLKIRLIQATKGELVDDVTSGASLQESALSRLLVEPATVPGSESFGLLLGAYAFDHSLEDLAVLERMANIGRMLGAPFVSSAAPTLLGLGSFSDLAAAGDVSRRMESRDYDAWHMLRRSANSQWCALALPGWLGRLPYGATGRQAESFDFEEGVSGKEHTGFLWTNAAFAVGVVVAAAFAESGWGFRLSAGVPRIEGLPLFVYRSGTDSVTQPCAETWMTESMVESLESAGLIPLVSYRDRDMVALACLQGLHEPRRPLTWST